MVYSQAAVQPVPGQVYTVASGYTPGSVQLPPNYAPGPVQTSMQTPGTPAPGGYAMQTYAYGSAPSAYDAAAASQVTMTSARTGRVPAPAQVGPPPYIMGATGAVSSTQLPAGTQMLPAGQQAFPMTRPATTYAEQPSLSSRILAAPKVAPATQPTSYAEATGASLSRGAQGVSPVGTYGAPAGMASASPTGPATCAAHLIQVPLSSIQESQSKLGTVSPVGRPGPARSSETASTELSFGAAATEKNTAPTKRRGRPTWAAKVDTMMHIQRLAGAFKDPEGEDDEDSGDELPMTVTKTEPLQVKPHGSKVPLQPTLVIDQKVEEMHRTMRMSAQGAVQSGGLSDFLDGGTQEQLAQAKLTKSDASFHEEDLSIEYELPDEARIREEALREAYAEELLKHDYEMCTITSSLAGMPSPTSVNTISTILADQLPTDMISCREGTFALRSDDSVFSGNYSFNVPEQALSVGGETVGHFTCARVGAIPRQPLSPDIPCIAIHDSEIMREIQNPESQGAVFVLPSQLNGAEYPSDDCIVERIEDYKYDNTGGPRGQLAVHPAAGQFMLDNAASVRSPAGINSVAQVVKPLQEAGFKFDLVNGYLKVPVVTDDEHGDMCPAREVAMTVLRQNLANLRTLLMENVPACGLTPDKRGFCKATHQIHLIYASAVPVQAYLNAGRPDQAGFQMEVARSFLTAAYFGALKVAAQPQRHLPGQRVKVFLMPLGGGVFNNPWELIAEGMSQAVESLSAEELERLDIRALTWSGNPSEKQTLSSLLQKSGKLLR